MHAGVAPGRLAFDATVHCLTGCAIGEVIGLAVTTALETDNLTSIAAGIVLAFVFGYGLTFFPLVRGGMPPRRALGVTFAAESVSIGVMETVDSAVVLLVPGAMDAGLADPLFWGSLAASLAAAFVAAYPVNRWLIARGAGHAVAMREGHGTHA